MARSAAARAPRSRPRNLEPSRAQDVALVSSEAAEAIDEDEDDHAKGGTGEAAEVETALDLMRMFEAADEAAAPSRKISDKCRRYYNNIQWTDTEIATLNLRKQPVVTQNKIKPKIEYMTGLEVRRRTDPKVYPTRPVYTEDADSSTFALRYACDCADFKTTKSEVWEEMLIEGGPTGAIITVEMKANGHPHINATHTPYDRVFVDAHARRRDYDDARYKGIIIWMDQSDAEATWPEGKGAVAETFAAASSLSYDDKPDWVKWCDRKRRRVRVIEIYYKRANGEWWQATLTGGGFLAEPQKVVYLDQFGETECPLELVSNYRKQDNSAFGLVEEMLSRQDEINKRRSKLLHIMSMRQIRASRKAKNANKISDEVAKPDGIIIADKDDFEILDNHDMSEGHYKLMLQSEQEFDQSTANAALTGTQQGDPSGKAIALNQQGGQIQIESPLDRLRNWQLRVYKQIWNRIRQYWTGPMWIRLTGDPSNMKWVGLNQPMTRADQLARQKNRPLTKFEMARLGPAGMQPVNDNEGKPLLKAVPAELDADIIIDEGPDTVTLEQEQFAMLADLAGKGVPIPPVALIEASSLRNKDKIIDAIKSMMGAAPPGAPGQGPPGAPPGQPQAGGAQAGPPMPMAPPPQIAQAAMTDEHGQEHPPLDEAGNPVMPPQQPPLDPSMQPPPITPADVNKAADADHAHTQAMAKHHAGETEAEHRRHMEGRKMTLSEKQHELAEQQFAMQNPHAQVVAQMLGAMGDGATMDGQASPGLVIAQAIGQLAKAAGVYLKLLTAPDEFIYGQNGEITGKRKLLTQDVAQATLAEMATPVPGTTPLEVLSQAIDQIANIVAEGAALMATPKIISQGPGGRPDEVKPAVTPGNDAGGSLPPPEAAPIDRAA